MKKYGYIRVSTKEQKTDRQVAAMTEYGIAKENIFADRQSGSDFERPEWLRLKKRLRRGDVLAVQSIDRLGRNYKEILEQWRRLKDKNVAVAVLDMPLLNTAEESDLMRMFIADVALQLMSYMAETERVNIKKRQAEGIAAAKARGVHCGRPEKPFPCEFEQVYAEYAKKKITRKQAAEKLKMQPYTFSYTVRKYESIKAEI